MSRKRRSQTVQQTLFSNPKRFKLPECLRDKCSETPKNIECKMTGALKKAQVNAQTFYKHWKLKLDAIRSCDEQKHEMIKLLKGASLFWSNQPKSQQDRLELKANFIRQIVDPKGNALESKLGSSDTNHRAVNNLKMEPTDLDAVLQNVRDMNESKLGSSDTNHRVVNNLKMEPTDLDAVLQNICTYQSNDTYTRAAEELQQIRSLKQKSLEETKKQIHSKCEWLDQAKDELAIWIEKFGLMPKAEAMSEVEKVITAGANAVTPVLKKCHEEYRAAQKATEEISTIISKIKDLQKATKSAAERVAANNREIADKMEAFKKGIYLK